MKQICQLGVQGVLHRTAQPRPISIHTECAPSHLWQPWRSGSSFPKHNMGFLEGRGVWLGQWILCCSSLQGGESPLSPSAVSHSDSASSTQSLSHGGAPELLVGLSYNATTGRLSVEMIKGSHFRNLSVNRAPGKCLLVPQLWSSPSQGKVEGCVYFHLHSLTLTIKVIWVRLRHIFTKRYLWMFQMPFFLIRVKASLRSGCILIQNTSASMCILLKGKK